MKKPIALALLATTLFANAQTVLPVKKVTIFKNSTAMVVKEGNATVKDGTVKLPIPGQTQFGTYFIGAGKDNAIKNIVFRNDTVKSKAIAKEVWQYLAGNPNKQVTLAYTPTQGIDKTVTGKVTSYDLYSGIVRFTTDAGRTIVMNANSIYQADFKEEPSAFYMADSIKRMAVLKPEKVADNINLQQVHMTGGINWIPSYYLRLTSDKAARLEMKAVVENFAEDLKDTETELVVGAPQMIHSGRLDPITYDYISGSNFDNDKGLMFAMQSNAITTTALRKGFIGAAGDGAFESTFTTEGEKAGDMYIYKLGKITLAEQAKGTFPIFAASVDYKDKYEGTIADGTNYFYNRFVPQEEKTYDVFHSLELKNVSNVPLTTASVMVVNEKEQFVAQDEIKYTPVGATTNIRLSKAIDIIMKNQEEEKTREDNAKKIGKVSYSKVVLKGTVNVENYQDKDATITVTKALTGTVLGQSNDGKVTKKNSYTYINPASEIKWEVKLAAGEKKTLTYEYEVFFTP